MYIYYDPQNNNQIMALYSGVPKTKAWTDRGYILAEVPEEWEPDLDKRVILDDNVIAGLEDSPSKDTIKRDLKTARAKTQLKERRLSKKFKIDSKGLTICTGEDMPG